MEKEIELKTLINAIKSNRLFLFLFNFIFISIILVYSLIMPHNYSSSSSILPPSDASSKGGLSSLLSNFSGGASMILGGAGKSAETDLYEEVLSSRTIIKKVIDKLKLDTISQYQDLLNTELIETVSEMYDIELQETKFIYLNATYKTSFLPSDEEKEFAAKTSKALNSALLESMDEILIKNNNSSARLSFNYVSQQIDNYKIELDSIAYAMEKFQSENNVLDIENQVKAIVTQAIEISTEIAKTETELSLAKIDFSSESKQVEILNKQLEVLKDQARKIEQGGNTENNFSIPLQQVPELFRIYAGLYRDREVLEQVIIFLETQRHEEAIQVNKDTPIIQVLDAAEIPEKRSAPSRGAMMIVGGTISIILSFVALLLSFYFKKT
jgi:uncharacterized protein involved in exopolysaccharide biosynthesis